MKHIILSTTTAAALMTAPMAYASGDSASDLQGNSPAITEGGDANAVGSTPNTLTPSARADLGIAEFDATTAKVTQEEYFALVAAVGEDFITNDGKKLGVVSGLMFDGQGNPEMVVDLNNDTKIDAETLVITLTGDAMDLRNGKIFLDTSEDELYLKAQDGSKRDDETRTTVVIM